MNIRMIVTDLDRTLLRSDKTVSDYTARVMLACKERGIMTAFATARSERSCGRFAEAVRPGAIISNGGALVRWGGETVYRAAMSAETGNELLNALLRSPEAGYITVDTDKGYFVNKPVDESDPGWAEYLPACPADFSRGLDCDSYKITVEFFSGAAAYEIASAFPAVEVIPFSDGRWFRFAGRAAGKQDGVRALAARAGIELEHIAAFGDDYNDVEMLRECGIGVAVANAIDEARAAADYICGTSDDDGVAKWLEEHVL